jgi:hypothetical protein
MKKKTIEVCEATIISICCDYNDEVDVRCGGPATVGYDFGVSSDEDIKEYKKLIEGWCRKYRRGFMGISTNINKEFPVKHLWYKERIEKCIKENGF